MHRFTATLQKFKEKGEKSGWIFLEIPLDVTNALNPGVKTSKMNYGEMMRYFKGK